MEQNLATWGIALSTNMWWFELLLLQQGVDLVDQDNGRAGPATRTVFADNELSYQIAEKWLELYQKGYASNTGFASSDCRTVFLRRSGSHHFWTPPALCGTTWIPWPTTLS